MGVILPLLSGFGYHSEDKAWFYPPSRDIPAWHMNAFASQSFTDGILEGRPTGQVNPGATLQYQKGLSILRQRLDEHDQDTDILGDTIGAVVKLATAVQFDGDAGLAMQHMRGLRNMTDLRGGMSVFEDNPKVLVENLRCDLSVALATNTMPVFYRQMTEILPDFPQQVISNLGPKISCPGDLPFVKDMDVSLAGVGRGTKEFCLLVNLATQTKMLALVTYLLLLPQQ